MGWESVLSVQTHPGGARARAERVTHRALLEGMAPEQAAELDGLLTPLPERGGSSTFAWLRQASGSPAARNLVGLVERLRTVRQLGLDRRPALGA